MYAVKRLAIVCLLLAGCGSAAAVTAVRSAGVRPAAAPRARWTPYVHVSGPIDVVGPRHDGAMVLAAGGRLWLLGPSGGVRAFAPAYHSNPGLEAYIALSPGGCFGRDTVYAISFGAPRGVMAVDARGRLRPFATISAPGLMNGIAFGRELLVTINHRATTTVDAVGCRGTVRTITSRAPRVEGGVAVAPASFGRFAGDLIAPDEIGGNIYAVTPAGRTLPVARSGLPHGGDIGVESEAFLPAHGAYVALLADRFTPGNRHPGDDVVLRVGSAALAAAGARGGDLLVAGEGGAETDAVHCDAGGCAVRHVADGPAVAHGEGHVAIVPR